MLRSPLDGGAPALPWSPLALAAIGRLRAESPEMMGKAVAVRILGGLAATLATMAADMPPAPAGFAWTRLPEIRADLLKPSGWTLDHQRKGGSETYRLAAPKKAGSPAAALDINWVADVPGLAGMVPSKYAAGLVATASESHKILERESGTIGSLASVAFRFADSGPGRDGLMVRYQLVANDRTGSLYILAFEAPAREWTNSWKTGAVMMDRIRWDPAR
ncbi:MAG: hypothetical protein J0L84_15215 [Verrucomicrobia bacterium]|nr:hypothetical protein [Verrucomicrobiota bacterium]